MAKTQTKINGIAEPMLVEIIKRIVAVAKPQKIILFGSGARGQLGPSSDLDILVVKDGAGRRTLAQEIYSHMRGIEVGLHSSSMSFSHKIAQIPLELATTSNGVGTMPLSVQSVS